MMDQAFKDISRWNKTYRINGIFCILHERSQKAFDESCAKIERNLAEKGLKLVNGEWV